MMSVGLGGPSVMTGYATDKQGNTRSFQGTSSADILRQAQAFGDASMPGQNGGNTGRFTGSAGAGQQVANPQGGYSMDFGTKTYKPGVTPGSSTFRPAAVQPGAVTPALPPAGQGRTIAQQAVMPGQNPVADQTAQAVSNNLSNPGISAADTQGMVNKAREVANSGRAASKVSAREAAMASGFGDSGGAMANNADIDDEYDTKAQGAERDIRLGAAGQNASLKNQAIGLGLQYSGQQNQMAESDADRAMRQQQQDWSQNVYEQAKMPGQGANTGGWSGWSRPKSA